MPDLTTTIAPDDATHDAAVSAADYYLWDFAGVDGLQAAIALFTPAINHIAPFQSLTTEFNQQACSVLRLCENNFRVALPVKWAFDAAIATLHLKVWCKPCPAAILVIPVALGLERLPKIGTTKPLYTLNPFPCDRAVPARITGSAILAWHHHWQEQPRLEIQTASTHVDTLCKALSSAGIVIV
ncbi:MAG: hypothetical protein F6K42_28690 [Leptolyngbya sp. SIO1D8]|nr:hypothetical protein [Leptolyngbya sp. SIO1D8]